MIRDRRFETGRLLDMVRADRQPTDPWPCPYCHSHFVVRWGGFAGRHRFRCKRCRRTFSDFTGTCLAYLKRTDAVLAYAAGMQRSETVRSAASRLDISPTTAFRFRHRLLARLRRVEADRLEGRILLSEIAMRYSQKGQRNLPRPARRRGGGPAIGYDRVLLIFAQEARPVTDNSHGFAGEIAGRYMVTSDMLRRALLPLLVPGCTIVAPFRRFSAYASFCNAARLKLETPNGEARSGGKRALLPPIAVRDGLAHQFRSWLEPFRGVATRYLDHYIGWFLLYRRWGEFPVAEFARSLIRLALSGEHRPSHAVP
jgi:transposase-like protein